MEITQALQAIIDNPDDLTTLPQIIAKVQELESKVASFTEIEQQYQERIQQLQELNRAYLAQIPIPGTDTTPEEDEEQEVTFEQAKEELIKTMQNI